MEEKECYDYLISLPGMGPKSALCVMMYSLEADVFPVDVNVQRVGTRLGALKQGLSSKKAQKLMPPLIADGVCRKLHVTMLIHGRVICRKNNPLCGRCMISDLCRTGRRKLRKQKR